MNNKKMPKGNGNSPYGKGIILDYSISQKSAKRKRLFTKDDVWGFLTITAWLTLLLLPLLRVV